VQYLGTDRKLAKNLKRPWILSPNGKRTALHLANVASLLLFLAYALHFVLVETPRQNVVQLDPKNVSYCHIAPAPSKAGCPEIQGLELTNGQAAIANLGTQANGTSLTLDFTNHLQLQGSRELWLRLENPNGEILELARVEIELGLKSRTTAEFLLVSDLADIQNGKLLLGY
jgi:hypothetical protein